MKLDIELHLQVWKELAEFFTGNDSGDAAEAFIRVLIEHGANAEEILEYAIDDDVKLALQEYVEVDADEFDEELSEEYD